MTRIDGLDVVRGSILGGGGGGDGEKVGNIFFCGMSFFQMTIPSVAEEERETSAAVVEEGPHRNEMHCDRAEQRNTPPLFLMRYGDGEFQISGPTSSLYATVPVTSLTDVHPLRLTISGTTGLRRR